MQGVSISSLTVQTTEYGVPGTAVSRVHIPPGHYNGVQGSGFSFQLTAVLAQKERECGCGISSGFPRDLEENIRFLREKMNTMLSGYRQDLGIAFHRRIEISSAGKDPHILVKGDFPQRGALEAALKSDRVFAVTFARLRFRCLVREKINREDAIWGKSQSMPALWRRYLQELKGDGARFTAFFQYGNTELKETDKPGPPVIPFTSELFEFLGKGKAVLC